MTFDGQKSEHHLWRVQLRHNDRHFHFVLFLRKEINAQIKWRSFEWNLTAKIVARFTE